MTTLNTTIVNGSSQMRDGPVGIALTQVRATAKPQPRKKKAKAKPAPVDAHTLSDIGIAPGSITWMH